MVMRIVQKQEQQQQKQSPEGKLRSQNQRLNELSIATTTTSMKMRFIFLYIVLLSSLHSSSSYIFPNSRNNEDNNKRQLEKKIGQEEEEEENGYNSFSRGIKTEIDSNYFTKMNDRYRYGRHDNYWNTLSNNNQYNNDRILQEESGEEYYYYTYRGYMNISVIPEKLSSSSISAWEVRTSLFMTAFFNDPNNGFLNYDESPVSLSEPRDFNVEYRFWDQDVIDVEYGENVIKKGLKIAFIAYMSSSITTFSSWDPATSSIAIVRSVDHLREYRARLWSTQDPSFDDFDRMSMWVRQGTTLPEIPPVPTLSPTKEPTTQPTPFPTRSPTRYPTKSPTLYPTQFPTRQPTQSPTRYPTRNPTISSTLFPTRFLTRFPTSYPTKDPTPFPTTNSPTLNPTKEPTLNPTKEPTLNPIKDLTSNPTKEPTLIPTKDPTSNPTKELTSNPTKDPTSNPTKDPTSNPTKDPISNPTSDSTSFPTNKQQKEDLSSPTIAPTIRTTTPTTRSTFIPTSTPTLSPIFLTIFIPGTTTEQLIIGTNVPTKNGEGEESPVDSSANEPETIQLPNSSRNSNYNNNTVITYMAIGIGIGFIVIIAILLGGIFYLRRRVDTANSMKPDIHSQTTEGKNEGKNEEEIINFGAMQFAAPTCPSDVSMEKEIIIGEMEDISTIGDPFHGRSDNNNNDDSKTYTENTASGESNYEYMLQRQKMAEGAAAKNLLDDDQSSNHSNANSQAFSNVSKMLSSILSADDTFLEQHYVD